jgi:hypothetical protein
MRDAVTPPLTRSARVIAALQRLDADAGRLDADTSATVIEHHAQIIHVAMLDLIVARRARGFDIGRDDSGAYARPRSKITGPARELRDLRPMCRKAVAGKLSAQDWTTTWAAQPVRIRRLVWKPLLVETPEGRSIDRSTLAMGFEAEGFAMLAPKPEVVLPAIERELAIAKITATPGAKTRKPDGDAVEAKEAIRAAYRAITGNRGGRVIRNGRLAGRLAALGRNIDAIFGTRLYAVKDSTRLR